MRKTPSHEDEQLNDIKKSARRTRRPKAARQQDLENESFFNDEHPEIPVTRRASRFLDDTNSTPIRRTPAPERRDRQPDQTRTTRKQKQYPYDEEQTLIEQPTSRTNKSRIKRYQEQFMTDDALEDHHNQSNREKNANSSSTGRIPVQKINTPRSEHTRPARSQAWSEQDELEYGDEYDEYDTYQDPAPQRRNPKQTQRIPIVKPSEDDTTSTKRMTTGTQKTVQARLNRPALYEANTAQEIKERVARREKRQQDAIQSQWQQLLHNRTVMTITGIVLALLLLFTLISTNLNHPATQTQTQSGVQSQQGTPDNSHPILKPTNPHELVIVPPAGNTHTDPPVLATSAYLLNTTTGATLYAHNPFMHIPMMSTTKLMTALLTVQHIKNLDQPIKITPGIANDLNSQLSPDSSLMGIKKGETYSVRQIMYGLFLVSGNDAAIVLADTVSGNVPSFVTMMNQQAKQLGLNDTHFRNPHGLMEDGHYSSAHDLAFLARAAFSNPTIKQIAGTKEYMIPANGSHAAHDMLSGSQFLFWYPGADAGKTGWDAAANFVQIVSVTRNNQNLIGVVMHTDDWWTDMRNLMDYGFNNYTWISPRELNAAGHLIPYAAEWSYFEIDTRQRALPMGAHGRFYDFTGYGISGSIMSYFDKNKGLAKFGFPISQPQNNGITAISQRFEHGTIICNVTTQQCRIA